MDTATRPHILMIDDDVGVRDLMLEYLGKNDLRVRAGASGREMFEVLEREAIDLVLFDLKLPGEDGMQLARALRERAKVPIVLLTGRNEEADRVTGLELRADDYVTKPLAGVSCSLGCAPDCAVINPGNPARARQRAPRFPVLGLGTQPAHPAPRRPPDGRSAELSNREFSLLGAFCRAPQRALSRYQLLSMSRLHEAEVYYRTVDSHFRRLRTKIEPDPATPALIVTERGSTIALPTKSNRCIDDRKGGRWTKRATG